MRNIVPGFLGALLCGPAALLALLCGCGEPARILVSVGNLPARTTTLAVAARLGQTPFETQPEFPVDFEQLPAAMRRWPPLAYLDLARNDIPDIEALASLYPLTIGEKELLVLMSKGYSSNDIADNTNDMIGKGRWRGAPALRPRRAPSRSGSCWHSGTHQPSQARQSRDSPERQDPAPARQRPPTIDRFKRRFIAERHVNNAREAALK